MLSRRNIRIKVMQTLYAVDSLNDEIKIGEPQSILIKKVEQSRQLLTYLVYFITEIARFAEKDALQKANKHLPTQGDLNVNTKIAGNQIVWQFLDADGFAAAVSHFKLEHLVDRDLLKKIYQKLVDTEEYITYIQELSREPKKEKAILDFIFTELLLPNEDFINHIEEKFINWDDDAEMMSQLIPSLIQRPSSAYFSEVLDKEKMDFAKNLTQTVLDKAEVSRELIKPKLKNWDADRIASLDMIILQMGICELLYFETIPTKVTINEYIDLAKEYSTPQSGQFVNGLLDNLHKELLAQGKIHKVNFVKKHK
ncbi:MAG: transcription antitermination factor NusB [Ferruginibacter sp.]|nr:transcription antitermination factor NusB [Ferruginibacter sp.]